jgi:hypothetical protein
MHRFTDLDYAKLHFQELYAEAERERLIKNSKQFEPGNQTHWYVQILDRLSVWVARWRCKVQARIPQSQGLFYGLNLLAPAYNPCSCNPEPCTE